MKIFIPFTIKDIGGTATFVRKFSDALVQRGFEVVFCFEKNFDVLFVIADCPLRYALYAKLSGKKIIQRLDGAYNPASVSGWLYPLYNFKMKIIHNFLADYVIYQSKYSQYACETMFGKRKGNSTVIYNGTDLKEIHFQKESHTTTELLTFAAFRRTEQIEPIVKAMDFLDGSFKLTVFGSYTENLRSIFENFKQSKTISFEGKLSNVELIKRIGKYDIFLFSDLSACPNSVIEALATGLPVVAYDRGSVRELVDNGKSGELIIIKKHNPLLEKYHFTQDDHLNFSRGIKKVAENISVYKKNARKLAEERFDLNKIIDEYASVFKKYI